MNYEVISIETARIMAEIEKENQELQDRIDRAIPKLKELNKKIKDILKIGIDIKEITDIANILKGENNE